VYGGGRLLPEVADVVVEEEESCASGTVRAIMPGSSVGVVAVDR